MDFEFRVGASFRTCDPGIQMLHVHRADASHLMPSPVRKEGSSSPQSGVRGVASACNYIA